MDWQAQNSEEPAEYGKTPRYPSLYKPHGFWSTWWVNSFCNSGHSCCTHSLPTRHKGSRCCSPSRMEARNMNTRWAKRKLVPRAQRATWSYGAPFLVSRRPAGFPGSPGRLHGSGKDSCHSTQPYWEPELHQRFCPCLFLGTLKSPIRVLGTYRSIHQVMYPPKIFSSDTHLKAVISYTDIFENFFPSFTFIFKFK